ncbi:MAG: sigma-70 family RNA polymerase sigma factor [Flavobacteriales bacterium]|nr:sigma-70 family RNA polymerase sigma factor [Flavobacteriales bacterium]
MLGKTYHTFSDEDLMLHVAAKDSKAFAALYDRYSGRVVNYFHRMLWQDEELAQDFMQELFMKIVHKPELYQQGRPFKTWFFSIANNMCKNEYRRREVRKGTANELPEQVMGESGLGIESNVDHTEFRARLNEALEELDEAKRSVFLLRYEQDMSIKEISEALECSEGTVKSRLFYTLKMLNSKLKAFEGIGAMLIIMNWINEWI